MVYVGHVSRRGGVSRSSDHVEDEQGLHRERSWVPLQVLCARVGSEAVTHQNQQGLAESGGEDGEISKVRTTELPAQVDTRNE